ncbi:MAG: hypothetical protein LBH22_05040 [Bacteroidales bacterium]|jgi:hypothetical protein|nr:hypothetical protein [Bacteroidales bacterium]
MKVIILPEVQEYLDSLVPILYEKEYFGFEESAIGYVDELIANIKTSLHRLPHKPASVYFDQYEKDMHYAAFKVNPRTTWYAFFTKYSENGTTIYLIQRIENNHTIAHYL